MSANVPVAEAVNEYHLHCLCYNKPSDAYFKEAMAAANMATLRAASGSMVITPRVRNKLLARLTTLELKRLAEERRAQ